MSETLWAVTIGGLIAIAGSAATQLTMFWLNKRKEKQDRRFRALEILGRFQSKKAVAKGQQINIGDFLNSIDRQDG